jgi:hypothetical protein
VNSLVNDTEIGSKTGRVRIRFALEFDKVMDDTVFSTEAIED